MSLRGYEFKTQLDRRLLLGAAKRNNDLMSTNVIKKQKPKSGLNSLDQSLHNNSQLMLQDIEDSQVINFQHKVRDE